MGKRVLWLVPVLALLLAAGCGSGGPLGGVFGITSIDDACQAIDASAVNNAMGVDDVKLLVDEPFTSGQVVEPGRECGYLNKKIDDLLTIGDDIHGIVFSVKKYNSDEWKFDDDDFAKDSDMERSWEKLEIGDVAFYSTLLPGLMVVRHGDWMLSVVGAKPLPLSDDDFVRATRELTKQFVSNLPRS